MKRTINFTSRARIDRKHVQVRLLDASLQQSRVAVRIDLRDYDLPEDARVYIEAYAESSFARREIENPFDPFLQQEIEFQDFGVSNRPKFRIRVVDDASSGRMRGWSDGIPLENPADVINSSDSLLPSQWDDTGQEIWKIEVDESSGPILYLSRNLQEHQSRLNEDPMFTGCVVPNAFRRVLEAALRNPDDEFDPTDDESWFFEWRRWMSQEPELAKLEAELTLIDGEALDRWIDDAVAAFARMRKHMFATKVSSAYDGGE